jgi:hypothetical protein
VLLLGSRGKGRTRLDRAGRVLPVRAYATA